MKGRKCSGFPDGMNDVAGTEQIIKLLFKHGMDHYLNQHIKFLIIILKLCEHFQDIMKDAAVYSHV